MTRRWEFKYAAMLLCTMACPVHASASPVETVLYSFTGGNDGAQPTFGLTKVGTTLYGGTTTGGANGEGVYFSISESGQFKIIYTVTGGNDASPYAPMLFTGGALYGYGYIKAKTADCLCKMTLDGQQSVLYNFLGQANASPVGAPVEMNGKFYGVSEAGGSSNGGMVFSVTKSGTEEVLHNFTADTGAVPVTGLTVMNGILYGVTTYGGAWIGGTAFSMTPGGMYSVLYDFGEENSYDEPYGTLLPINGILYGTTASGGITHGDRGGQGALYSLTTTGTITFLHPFSHRFEFVEGNLVLKGKFLYGTGGAYIFKENYAQAGKVRPVYQFKNDKNNYYPNPGLVQVGDAIYGTTKNGGTYGYGTIFKLTP